MRDVVCIYTGPGAVGSFDKIAVYTGQFSSCSPVLMFNEKAHDGGLYHLPGKNGDTQKLKNDEWHNLKAMLYLVKPTVVMPFPCGDYALRQGFIAGTDYDVSLKITDADMEEAQDDWDAAKIKAFDRVYQGDQRELGLMFAKTKAAKTIGCAVELQPINFRGIQVTANSEGHIELRDHLETGPGGKTYDLKKGKFTPKELCAIMNPDINYSLWQSATV